MSILDKLFSREIKRRTGAHAISILIDENAKTRKRSRSLGANALKFANEPNLSAYNNGQPQGTFFRRLDIRFPWLKLIVIPMIILTVILNLFGITISHVGEVTNKINTPMSRHVRITDRDLTKMLVALTFDDGPSGSTTPALLDILAQRDVPVTFFMLGSMARNNPELVKRVAKERHEIASHTMYHQNLIRIPASSIISDINEAKDVFSSILGKVPSLTRPPYGNINDTVKNTAGTPLILWSVDTLDWKSKDPNAILATAMSQIHDGAIILMHDVHPTSVEAVPALVDALRSAGYEFVTVSELANLRHTELLNDVIYYNLRP